MKNILKWTPNFWKIFEMKFLYFSGNFNYFLFFYIFQDELSESELSWAPTEIYNSPLDTPKRLSLIDLTLTPEVSKYDLKSQMAQTEMMEGETVVVENSKRVSRWCELPCPRKTHVLRLKWPKFQYIPKIKILYVCVY